VAETLFALDIIHANGFFQWFDTVGLATKVGKNLLQLSSNIATSVYLAKPGVTPKISPLKIKTELLARQ